MSFEKHSTNWALSLFDAIESPDNKNARMLALAGGAVVTIGMWIGHLFYPEVFLFFLEQRGWAKLILGVVLAPPFVLAFAAGCFISPQSIEPVTNEIGPMSTYFYQERSSKRWKLVMVAALIAAVNFLLMFVTSGV